MKDISVIIPVYNGEEYIERCIDSVLGQVDISLEKLEILLLNDGSKDSSLKILKRYEKKHPSIVKAIDQQNIGVARTRNKGIKLARGKYIIFIDQDDYINPDYCSTLYAAIENGGYDMVFSDFERPDINGRIINRSSFSNDYFSRLMCVPIWAKIHRTDFLRREHIELFNNSQGEDVAFSFEEAQKTEKIGHVSYCGYNWFFNPRSVSNTTQRGLDKENVASILRIQQRLIELDAKRSNVNKFYITMMTAYYLFFAGRASSSSEFMEAVRVLMGNLKKAYPDYARNPLLIVSPRGTLRVFSIGVKAFMMLYKLGLLGIFARVYCKGKLHE